VITRDRLVEILESVPEIKDLVIDPQLMKPLDHFTGASFLKVTTKSLNYHNSAQDSCQSNCDLKSPGIPM